MSVAMNGKDTELVTMTAVLPPKLVL
jgi:hypothetical protein